MVYEYNSGGYFTVIYVMKIKYNWWLFLKKRVEEGNKNLLYFYDLNKTLTTLVIKSSHFQGSNYNSIHNLVS